MSYRLRLGNRTLRHYSSTTWLFGDHTDHRDPKLDALARSGDYFITLATTLENIGSELTETSPVVTSLALARLSEELAYLQRHYTVAPKDKPDRLREV